MTVPDITYICEPQDVQSGTGSRDTYRRLLEAIGRRAEREISVRCGPPGEILRTQGYLLCNFNRSLAQALDELPPLQKIEVAERLVAILPYRRGERVFKLILEPYRLAGGITDFAIWSWEHSSPEECRAWGLYGRRDIGNILGAEVVLSEESEHYYHLLSRRHFGLPHLFVDYLVQLSLTQAS